LTLAYANAHRYARSRELFAEALKLIPGGVNSTARATWSGWEPHPLFIDHGEGAHLVDVDGNRYIDYLLGLGPMLLGHRPKKVTQAVVAAIEKQGTMFALPAAEETKLARKITAAVPSLDQVRLCNTGTEAVLYAVRLARAFTGRSKIIRFEGMYHGFSDGVYWSKHPRIAGSQDRPIPVPQGPGMPKDIERSLIILNWNDVEGLKEAIAREGADIAAVLTEPVMCNTGCILRESRHRAHLRRGDHRISPRPRRRARSLRDHAGSLDFCQGHRRRLSRRGHGWAPRHHGARRARQGVDGRHL
jgi:glutamate-1-semialdehyde 2,1-aminomutase